MNTLTPLQEKAMILLCTHVVTHGISPSYGEVGSALGIKSKHGVSNVLDILERGGFIKRFPKRARSIELLPSKYYHPTDCVCSGCADARYLASLKLIQAIEVDPPISFARSRDLRRLTLAMREEWLRGPRKSPKPRMKAAK